MKPSTILRTVYPAVKGYVRCGEDQDISLEIDDLLEVKKLRRRLRLLQRGRLPGKSQALVLAQAEAVMRGSLLDPELRRPTLARAFEHVDQRTRYLRHAARFLLFRSLSSALQVHRALSVSAPGLATAGEEICRLLECLPPKRMLPSSESEFCTTAERVALFLERLLEDDEIEIEFGEKSEGEEEEETSDLERLVIDLRREAALCADAHYPTVAKTA